MIYLITYDLQTPGRDYTTLYTTIKSIGVWWHYLSSVWLVCPTDVTSTVASISENLRCHIDKNDNLFVTTIGRTSDGWLPGDAWMWIKQRQTV